MDDKWSKQTQLKGEDSYTPKPYFVEECLDKNVRREYLSFIGKIESHSKIRSYNLNISEKLIFNKGNKVLKDRKHISFRTKKIYPNKTIIIINIPKKYLYWACEITRLTSHTYVWMFSK